MILSAKYQIKKDWALFIILVLLCVSNSIIPILGIPVFVTYLLFILFFCFYVKYVRVFKISHSDKHLLFLFLLLISIDKLNDFFYSGEIQQLISLSVSVSIVFFLLTINRCLEFWNLVLKCSLISVIFFIFISRIKGIPLSELDRDSSALLYIYVVLYVISIRKYSFFIFVAAILIENYLFEARSTVIALLIFVAAMFVFRFIRSICFKKMALILTLVISVAIINIAIELETAISSSSAIFTGRGLLWDAAVQKVINSSNTYNLICGFPTTIESLRGQFGKDLLESDSYKDEYMTNMLLGGHFHNGIMYVLYNTGFLGLLILILILFKAFKRIDYNKNNISAFLGFFIVYLLNGRSIYGIYILSIGMLFFMLVPLKGKLNENK